MSNNILSYTPVCCYVQRCRGLIPFFSPSGIFWFPDFPWKEYLKHWAGFPPIIISLIQKLSLSQYIEEWFASSRIVMLPRVTKNAADKRWQNVEKHRAVLVHSLWGHYRIQGPQFWRGRRYFIFRSPRGVKHYCTASTESKWIEKTFRSVWLVNIEWFKFVIMYVGYCVHRHKITSSIVWFLSFSNIGTSAETQRTREHDFLRRARASI